MNFSIWIFFLFCSYFNWNSLIIRFCCCCCCFYTFIQRHRCNLVRSRLMGVKIMVSSSFDWHSEVRLLFAIRQNMQFLCITYNITFVEIASLYSRDSYENENEKAKRKKKKRKEPNQAFWITIYYCYYWVESNYLNVNQNRLTAIGIR